MGELPEYGPQNKWRNNYLYLENRLITMFGHMLVEMLEGQQTDTTAIVTLHDVTGPLRLLISDAVNALNTLEHKLGSSPGQPHEPAGHNDVGSNLGDGWNFRGLGAGLVASGNDEWDDGQDYQTWWHACSREELLVLPNLSGNVDANSPILAEDWKRSQTSAIASTTTEVGDFKWEPNKTLFTIQELLDHTELQCQQLDFPVIMNAWDTYLQKYEDQKHRHGQLE